MFLPNQTCIIEASAGTDVYGQPIPGVRRTERCAVVSLVTQSEKTSVRADSSASRGAAIEEQALSKILLEKTSKAQMDDIVIVSGHKLRIKSWQPRYDTVGRLDHIEITATMWSNDE